MNSKILITETDRKNILKLYGILNEQSQGNLVSNNVYKAIRDIESVFSYTDGSGKVFGNTFSGMEKEQNIKNAIENTIGLKTWFAIDEFTRGQIYSFMFQSDSGTTSKLRWLAGLAQSINSSINRGSIVGKPIQDSNVQNAIQLIQQSVKDGTIGNIYENYLSIVQQQYQSISGTINDNANRKKIWGPRPMALDKLMRGENWNDVKKWWINKINSSELTQQGQQTQQNKVNRELSVGDYNVGDVLSATYNRDNKSYTLRVTDIVSNGFGVIVTIDGRGGIKELGADTPGRLTGNSEFGYFYNISKK